MIFEYSTFDSTKLSFDVKEYKSIAFTRFHRLFDVLLGYIASHVRDDYGSGYAMDVLRPREDSDENPLGNTRFGQIVVKIGFGQYKFQTLNGEEAYAVYQHAGKPVGGDCGADVYQNLVIFTKSLESFGKFLSELVALSEKPEDGKFVCFIWLIRQQYWREEVRVNSRPLQSVVLPSAMKKRLLNDVEKFLSPKTKDFYSRNGIPYRRSYLFYGAPGTGKTSMVQAIAGHFKRNVCFLLPTHPEMTDDSLREAIQQIPDNSIVVFEDIDALFTKNRQNRSNKSALTFSGLLNSLDGIGSPHGQIFVLTTNLRENLDHALIRNGRVDLHIEFTFAIEEQMEQMWNNFYPDATHLGNEFAKIVTTALTEKNLKTTTSALQHFFINEMESTPEEALAAAPSIVEEVLRNSSSSMLAEAAEKKSRNRKNRDRAEGEASEQKEGTDEDVSGLEIVGTAVTIPRTAETQENPEKKKKARKRNRGNRKGKSVSGTAPEIESSNPTAEEPSSEKNHHEDAISSEAKREGRGRRERSRRRNVTVEVVYEKPTAKDVNEAKVTETIVDVKVDAAVSDLPTIPDHVPLPPRKDRKREKKSQNQSFDSHSNSSNSHSREVSSTRADAENTSVEVIPTSPTTQTNPINE